MAYSRYLTMANKPRIRFKGFTEDWEQREFSDIFAEVKSGLSRMLSNDDIGVPVVRANNINDGQLNLVDDIKYWYKNDPQGANTNNYLIEQGDILINFINSEAKMGTAAYVTRRPERDTIYTTNILRCKVNDEYNPYFIYSLTFLNSYKNYIASITKPAVNQASFTTVDFKKYSIKIPTIKEQNQIADLIEIFNKFITLHQCKLEKLKLTKKALLQKLFPKNGKHIPEIRFKGFTDAWEQRKLDDIAKIKTGGGTPKTANPEYWSGNIPWIQSSDLVEGDIAHVNINKFINNNALKNSAAKLISRDSIALVTRVGVGKVAVINQDFTTSQDFLSLSDFDGSDIKFLAYQLYRLMQENAKVLQGTSIKGITKTELIEQSISIPSSGQEQHLISNVLSKIDSIITLHQQEPFLYGNSINGGVELC